MLKNNAKTVSYDDISAYWLVIVTYYTLLNK